MVLMLLQNQSRKRAIDKLWYASLILVPLRALLGSGPGIFVAHRGLGKTILAPCSFGILIRTIAIPARAVEGATSNLPRYRRLGQNGGGQRKPDGRLVVEMMQILVRKEGFDDLIG